jgi:hypothetical protein
VIVEAARLTNEERAFLIGFEDDVEEAPWMVGNDYHRQAMIALEYALQRFVEASRPDLYVSSEIAVLYRRPNGRRGQVAPDVMVAMAENHPRQSFDVRKEGAFPAFVLEVVSPESRVRDVRRKVELYRLIGAQEYVIFDPLAVVRPQLQAYGYDGQSKWAPMAAGANGEIVSGFLGLTFHADGVLLRIRDRHGRLLRTPDEEFQARLAAELSQYEERQARLRAESETAALRTELDRLRHAGQ